MSADRGPDRSDDLRALVKEADLVTFDVFDTLLVRAVARPVDAFRVTAELLNHRTRRLVVDGVTEARVAAEVALRAEALAAGLSPDTVPFEAIWRRAGELAGYDDELVGLLAEMELEAERLLLSPAGGTAELLRFAVDQGATVWLVSDTYLPSAFVASVLERSAITGWSRLLVSCEQGAAKSDGSLWAQVVRDRPGARIVHIGDNATADLVQPRAFGVDAHQVPKPADALRDGLGALGALNGRLLFDHLELDGFRLRNTHRSVLQSLPGRLAIDEPSASAATACGYGALGPLLAGFVQWLHRTAVAAGHDHLFFLSRDGHLMRQAYQALLGPEALPSTYLLASRRLCNLAALGDQLTSRDVDFLSQASWSIAVGEFFSRLDVPGLEAAAAGLLAELGLSPDAPGAEHHTEVRACFWRLSDLLVERAAAERALLLEYWDGAGLLAARRPAVVDIGWHGSVQWSMQRVLGHAGIARDLTGLYFGLHPVRPPQFSAQPMAAFVDGARPEDGLLHRRLVLSSVSVLEFCFTRADGTVVGLDRDPSGTLVARHAPDTMSPDDAAVLHDVQQGALRYVADLAAATRGLPTTVGHVERDVAAEAMVLLLNSPSDAAAQVFGPRRHGDGFGVGVTWDPIGAPAHDADHYRANPGALALEAARASWSAGFAVNARRMGLDGPGVR